MLVTCPDHQKNQLGMGLGLVENTENGSQETIPQSVSTSSNPSLSSTHSINGRGSTVLSEDLIIKQLLKNRPPMTDVNEEFERERQRRMYNMLRHSNHYKRMQVFLF
jgi:hypothetical protein